MGSGFSKMKKQAKMFQEQMGQMQKELEAIEEEGTAGSGLVSIVMNGEKKIKKISIKPECVDPEDTEGLSDLIMAAYEEAFEKVEKKDPSQSMMKGLPF